MGSHRHPGCRVHRSPLVACTDCAIACHHSKGWHHSGLVSAQEAPPPQAGRAMLQLAGGRQLHSAKACTQALPGVCSWAQGPCTVHQASHEQLQLQLYIPALKLHDPHGSGATAATPGSNHHPSPLNPKP